MRHRANRRPTCHLGEVMGERNTMKNNNLLDVTATLETTAAAAPYVSLAKLGEACGAEVARLPHIVKILVENITRRVGGRGVSPPGGEYFVHGGILQMVLRQILANGENT